MRIALADDLSRAFWSDGCHCFAGLVAPLCARGHEVTVLDAVVCGPDRIVTGCARERDAAPLIASTRIVAALLAAPPDLCLFPAEEGLAHATLMARSCRELPAGLRVVLWRSPPRPPAARTPFRQVDGLRAITASAMRRYCAGAADLMMENSPPPSERTLLLRSRFSAAREVVFCGPFARESGFVAFIEAVELLDKRGRLGGRTVLFVGDFAQGGGAIDREWLGRRASGWRFRFSVRETRSLAEAISFAAGADRAALVARADPALVTRLAPTAEVAMLSIDTLFEPVALAERLLSGECTNDLAASPALDVMAEQLLGTMSHAPSRGDAATGLSVCILHYERPELLTQALDSVLGEPPSSLIARLEVVVLDNASRSPAARAALVDAKARSGVRVIDLADALPYSSALNVAASHASEEFLVLLDDDNLIAPGGLARLAAACASGAFDVVTSTLELFDADRERPVAITAFIGPAYTAGLFFNGFGDTSMAFRRTSFLSIGGFLQQTGAYPSADWILLCRAQAAGLRIGVMQQPAFRYRRNTHKAAEHWQPWDRELVRALLLEHYGDAFDPRDLAAAAQAMALELGV